MLNVLLQTALLAALAPPTPPLPAPPDTACAVMMPDRLPAEGRKSPLDSLTFRVNDQPVKVCYGRPSARGRTMLGGRLAYGRLWRTGANEPTTLATPLTLNIAGIVTPPGKYSLYTIPGEREWVVIVNRSTSQWGEESQYTDKVRAQEVGRAKVPAERLGRNEAVETFTMRAESEPGGDANALVLEWERTRIRVPISLGA